MARFPISRLTIKGYKSIREMVDFPLEKLNVLIGANGAGKSNFITLFRLINDISEERLQLRVQKSGGAHTLLYQGPKFTKYIEIQLDFGANSYYCKLVPTEKDSLTFEDESCYFQGGGYPKPYSVSLPNNGSETGLNKLTSSAVVGHVLESMKSWSVYHFHDTSDTSPMKRVSNINDNSNLQADASNLASFLYLLSQKYPKEYKNIVSTIRLVAPFFDDFILRPTELNEQMIQLEWKHTSSDEYFNAFSLSDGSLRFICLCTLLMQPKEKLPATILLDEPELGLHPYAITVLSNLLRSVSKHTQIIVSTQSVTLVNNLKPENMIVVDSHDSQSIFRRLTTDETEKWVDEFGLGDLWEKNIFGGRP